jgi:hypothetical protein
MNIQMIKVKKYLTKKAIIKAIKNLQKTNSKTIHFSKMTLTKVIRIKLIRILKKKILIMKMMKIY